MAERAFGLPPMLLATIARVESGRPDPATGRTIPWPWTLNVNAVGHFYATKPEAVEAILAFQAQGIRSIDVGCMQINLLHHPEAFASLDDALDPQTNAQYGARFLDELRRHTSNWAQAIQFYHSQTEKFGTPYLSLVASSWPAAVRYVSVPLSADAPEGQLDRGLYTANFRLQLRENLEDQRKLRAAFGPISQKMPGKTGMHPARAAAGLS